MVLDLHEQRFYSGSQAGKIMILERHLLEPFTADNIPPFPCPTCGASLVKREKGLNCNQSSEARVHYEIDCDYESCFGIFVLRLLCSQTSCKESVDCVGNYCVNQDERPTGEPYWTNVLTPLFFNPTILIFSLPKHFPEPIRKPLLESFSLFWSNPSASGNSLRIALEALMDNQRVNKSARNKAGKRFHRKLHDRIVEFAGKNSDIGDKLLALKWLGNSGSHEKGLKPEDLVTGLKLMEYAIEELFEKRSRNLAATAKRINRRKGPVSNIRSRAARSARSGLR